MNTKLEFLFARRSIRRYQDRPVPDAAIRDLLEAGMAAPSAVAKDPWHFLVVRDSSLRATIAEALPNGKMLTEAPVGIVVCGDMQRAHGGELSYLLQDCCAAIENILLAVTAMGLGACWLGVHPRQDRIDHIRGLFSLPDNILPVACLAIGWPAERKPARTRFNEACVHWEQW